MQVQIQQLGPSMIQQIQCMCSDCEGQGERISAKDRCKQCNGKKVIHKFYLLCIFFQLVLLAFLDMLNLL